MCPLYLVRVIALFMYVCGMLLFKVVSPKEYYLRKRFERNFMATIKRWLAHTNEDPEMKDFGRK